MTAPQRRQGWGPGRVAAGAFVVVVLAVMAGLLVFFLRDDSGGSAAEPLPAPSPTTAPAPSEPVEEPVGEATAPPTPPASEPVPVEPTELPTGDLVPGTTAFFHGEPATGPWQTIGSVSEITAPGAGPVARDDHQDFWAAHDLPDDLWDRLVARVSLEAVELGPPLERPVLNGAAGSEVFNARGGLRWDNDQTGGRGLLVAFDAVHDHDGLARWSRWAFIIHPETDEVLAELPRAQVTEDEVETVEEATDLLADQVWQMLVEHPVVEPQ